MSSALPREICPCGSYSLWKFLRSSISLRRELNAFLTKTKLDLASDDVWEFPENLFIVAFIFRNSTEKLEFDSFWTKIESTSYVLFLPKDVVEREIVRARKLS
jgi:hypothetical protein